MNWGKSLIIVMASFIIFITVLVVKMMSTSTDLESEDYYNREVNYEQEIAALKSTQLLDAEIKILQNEDYVLFELPAGKKIKNLEIRLIRPNNGKEDKVYFVKAPQTFLIAKSDLKKGSYKVEMRFETVATACMQKDNITI